MNEKLMELMKKRREGKDLSPVEKDAKMSVLEQLKQMAEDHMSNRLKDGMKKVTVASDSPEGIKEGLDKAKDLVDPDMEQLEEETGDDLDHDNEEGESPEHKAKVDNIGGYREDNESDEDEMSEDEINAKLEKLMQLKEKMKGKA